MASNAETNIWADGNVTFSTLSNESAPSVDNNGGAAVGSGTATLRGLMTAGGSATAYICWGAEPGDTVDGADTGTWDFVSAAISVSDNVAFSNAVSNLYYGIAYDYAVYVTNSEGEDWSSVANFTTASGPFWTPADIDTLIWYDATDAGTITASGGAVSQWRDKSGNGYHVGQVTTTIQPTTGSRDINGLNAIDLARDDMLSGIFSKSPSSLQIAIVTEWDSGGQDYMSMLSMNRDKLDMRENNAASLQILWNGGDYLGSSPGPASFNTPFIAGLKWDGTDLAALVNGNVGTVKSPRPGPIALSGIRFSHSGYAFDGAIGEAIILESGDDALRQKVEGYLAHKWSMTDDLASGHPYKNVAPGAPAITNTVGANFTPSSADIVGTLYATNSVFTVHAYWSTNSYAGAAAWTNAVAGGTASNVLVGSYTNVTGHSVTGSVSGLLSGTDYYYTFMATNAVTNIWASPNGNFTTSAGAGQIAIANAAADNISNVTARLNATLDCPGTNATVIAYWWQTGSGTTNSFAIGPYSDETASSVSHTASGLSPKTAYSFTFRATNATDNIWTDSTNTFTTHEIPEVGNGAGPVLRWQALAGWTAVTLNGEIVATNGVPVTTVRIYFGDNNPGAETADGWDITYAFPSVTGVGAFSTNITDLLYDETYYYTVYASNAYGAAWSTVTSITTGRDLWIPTNLAAEAWYDAADSSKVTLDDGKVRWWRDVSGNGKDAEQTTPANRPSTGGDIGGLNALVFDGDNYRLDTALEQLTTCTIVIVAGPSANGANHESVLLSATLASSTSGGLYLNTENYLTGDARHNVNYGSGILGSQKSYNGEVAASPSVFQNGIFAHWGSGFSTENRNYKIGNRHDNWNNGHYKGTIGEIIIIPSVLSDRIRQKVEGYLAHKWGLEGRLPTGHPYINNPPYASDRDSTVFRFR